MKHLSALVLCIALIAAAVPASAAHDDYEASVAAQAGDAIFVRPIMLGVSLITTTFYLATSPLTFLTDSDEEAGEALVYNPWWYTSGRDLGRFDQPRPN
jgi:hypothetical protein